MHSGKLLLLLLFQLSAYNFSALIRTQAEVNTNTQANTNKQIAELARSQLPVEQVASPTQTP